MKRTCPDCKRRIRVKKSRVMECKCGYVFNFDELYPNAEKVYLVDTNIIIYAINRDERRGKHCHNLLTYHKNIATTNTVMKEINYVIPYNIKVYDVKQLSPEILELHTNSLKQPSEQDKSILQCAINNPEIEGIITYDKDFGAIATVGIVNGASNSGKKFWLGNAYEFLKKSGRAVKKKKV